MLVLEIIKNILKMRWNFLEKIIWHGKVKDSSMNGPENIEINSQSSSSYDIKIKKISTVTIKNKENE